MEKTREIKPGFVSRDADHSAEALSDKESQPSQKSVLICLSVALS